MVGSKSRQGPRQGERILVDKYPESFKAELTEKGVYTQITDTTTGRSVSVPTAQVQIVQTVLEAFLPQGGAAKGVEKIEEQAAAPAASAPAAVDSQAPSQVSEVEAPQAKPAKAPAAKKPAAVKPGKPAGKPATAKKPDAAPQVEQPAPAATKTVAAPPVEGMEPWFDALPASIDVSKRMKLTKVVVAVDEKKKDRVVGLASENPKLPAMPAYSIDIVGVKGSSGSLNLGFVLAVSETKFLISAPQLGPKTSHRGIVPTAQRLEMLLETTSDPALKAA